MKIAYYGFASNGFIFKGMESLMSVHGHQSFYLMPSYHHLDYFQSQINAGRVLYLFKDFNRKFSEIDADLSAGFKQDALDKIFAADKSGCYLNLPALTKRKIVSVMHQIYRDYLVGNKIQVVVFPDVETVDGMVLLNVCKELGVTVCYYVWNRLFGGSFWAQNQYEKLPSYFGSYSPDHIVRARQLLKDFKNGVKLGKIILPAAQLNVPGKSVFIKALRFFKNRFSTERFRLDEDSQFHVKVLMRFASPYNKLRRIWSRLFHERFFNNDIPADPFIVYFLQYTPESSINGLEPYFVDQIRAVEAILFSLPAGVRLAVKEHPSMRGVRDKVFYQRLRRYCQVDLLSPNVPSKDLIQSSLAVATVTGTVGLEAFLSGKPCIQFGPNFFSHLNKPFMGLKDLKEWLADLSEVKSPSDEDIVEEIAKFLAISSDFFVLEPTFYPACLNEDNLKKIVESLQKHFRELSLL